MNLSLREEQIIKLLQQGKPNKLISFELGLSEGTVKQYLYSAFHKTGVANRTELALLALEDETAHLP